MGIVQWATDNIDVDELEISQDVTMMLLQMSPKELDNRWEGKLILKPLANSKRISVELRKTLNGTSVVIKIFDRKMPGKNILVHMSMSATAGFSVEDLGEMNLAIAEAIAVYKLPEHWVKLNKYYEEFQDSQQRQKDGKFVKVKI